MFINTLTVIAIGILSLLGLLVSILLVNPLWLMNKAAKSEDVYVYADVAYMEDKLNTPATSRHTMDIYVPQNELEAAAKRPVVMFVYGGAWDTGHKNDYRFAAMELAKLGFITVVPNYRLYPQVRFPHFIEDVANAASSTQQNLHNLLPDLFTLPEKDKPLDMLFVGHSAGAHTIAMLNSEPKYLADAQARFNSQINIKAVVGMAGPYDLPLDDPLVVGKFDGVTLHEVSDNHIDSGHEHNSHDANPINFAHEGMAPMYLLYGKADTTVGLYHIENFSKRLTELNVPLELKIYEKVPHKHMVAGLSVLFHGFNNVHRDVSGYLKRFL